MRTLHSAVAADEEDDEDDDEEDDEDVDDTDELVVAPGIVLVELDPVVAVAAEDDVDGPGPWEVVGSAGATATGASSPTWESARPTICQVSTVATTRAVTQAVAIFHEIMGQLSQDLSQ